MGIIEAPRLFPEFDRIAVTDCHEPLGDFRALLLSETIIARLEQLASDRDAIGALARTSQKHPNEFDKIVLHQGEFNKLVLHQWHTPAAEPSDGTDIHNHRWDFVSYVATGKIGAELFEPAASGAGRKAYRYTSPGDGDLFGLREIGTIHVQAYRSVSYGAGEVYFQPHEDLHAAWVEPHTVTVVLQGPVRQVETTVITDKPSQADGAHVSVTRCAASEITSHIHGLASHLRAQ